VRLLARLGVGEQDHHWGAHDRGVRVELECRDVDVIGHEEPGVAGVDRDRTEPSRRVVARVDPGGSQGVAADHVAIAPRGLHGTRGAHVPERGGPTMACAHRAGDGVAALIAVVADLQGPHTVVGDREELGIVVVPGRRSERAVGRVDVSPRGVEASHLGAPFNQAATRPHRFTKMWTATVWGLKNVSWSCWLLTEANLFQSTHSSSFSWP